MKLKLTDSGAATGGINIVDFPGITGEPPIPIKTNISSGGKTVSGEMVSDGSGGKKYLLHYKATVDHSQSSLTSLKFVDTLGGMQKLTGGIIKVDNADQTPTLTSDGFEYVFNSGSGVQQGTHTIEYDTEVTAEQYATMQAGGSSWETNSCKWVYNGDKVLPGGDTTYEIKKESPPKPTVTKTSSAGESVDPGAEITYNLTIEGKHLADMNFSDSMTDLQDVVGEPTVKVYVDGVENPSAAQTLGNVLSYNDDGNYNSYSTSVINKTIPKEDPFTSDAKTTRIEISYKTKVIDQNTATAKGIYGAQSINNTLTENWSWEQHTTTTKVEYTPETVTKVTKTESHPDDNSDGLLDAEGTITYTITVGDGTTTLDGVAVKDVASGDQQIQQDSYTISGYDVAITPNQIKPSYFANEPQQWDQTALDFTFPAGTGKGPITIAYKTKPYASNIANPKGITGVRTLKNRVYTSTDEDTTGVDYDYGTPPPFNVVKSATPKTSGGDASKLEPGETVDYVMVFGDNNTSINNTLTISDEMTDVQKLTGKVKVEIGTYVADSNGEYKLENGQYTYVGSGNGGTHKFEKSSVNTTGKSGNNDVTITSGEFDMPAAAYGWADDGVTWGYFDDGSYNTNNVRVFNFKFPNFATNVTGAVRVSYTTTIISKDEAATAGLMGVKDATNTAMSGDGKSSVTVQPEFPKNLNHNPDVTKEFGGWDDDGYTTWWNVNVMADEESSYPLEKLTLTEDWASGAIHYSTDWPVQNFNTNVLADIDLLRAEIVTDSGRTLQPGRDYTIDKEKGSFYFEKLEEPVSMRIAIHNPDATINTFYQHNQVKLTWQKDQNNIGEKTAEATGRRVKQEVDLTKSGKYNETSRRITWTVIFNPYFKEVAPEMSPIKFEDIMPVGLTLVDGSVNVSIQGNDWQNYAVPTSKITTTPKKNDVTHEDEGTILTVSNIDPQSRWGNDAKHDAYYWVADDGTWNTITLEEYGIKKNQLVGARIESDGIKGTDNSEGEIVKDAQGNVVGRHVHEVGLGLSKNSYTVTYQTEVSADEWAKITSSLTGRKVFQNDVTIGNGNDQTFTASNKVTVEGKDYLKKRDVTREDDEGYIIDEADMHDNAISYEVDINPKKLTLNSGKALTLTDRIDTIMELDTDSVKVYVVDAVGDRQELGHAQLAAQGIAISYNDDTRILTVSGLADKTSYIVAYKAVSRAYGTSTFTNTATLIGGGSHSDRVSDQHAITNDEANFWGNRHSKLELKKIDENDITNKLDDATFSLYRVNLETDTSDWTRADWMDLLEKAESGDPAVLAQIAQDFKQKGDPVLICSGLKSGDTSPQLLFDQGSVILEYDEYADTNSPTSYVDHHFLKEHTVYYWVENTPPDGFHATSSEPHYFIVYLDGELDDDYTQEEQRKKAAWALDDAVTIANGWTVASMSSDTTWKVNNTKNGYTSITATKVWEGDYDNKYETRPENGIQYDLYRVDKETGKETLMKDLSPVPVNDDGSGNWSSYTWYRLSDKYKYTVRERAVPGYITTYSDGGKGVEGGKITVTNTYVPKSTDVFVQKKWDPEGGAKPSQVKVSLYKILHRVNEDGSVTDEDPVPMGDDYTYMLTAANGWKYGWKGLDTSDPEGNTITYTVVEDVDAVNKDATVQAANVKYGAVYSDGGEGTVDAPESDPLVITNLANAPGSLKITKNVTVNGEKVSDTAADGIYRFRLTRVTETSQGGSTIKTEEPATYMHDHSSCGDNNSEPHTQYLVGDVTIKVQNGVSNSAIVADLEEGTYYVYEYAPDAPMELATPQRVEVKVVAGVTDEAKAPEASFTNNVNRNRVMVTKKWQSANEGTSSWPEGMEVEVKLQVKDGETLSNVAWTAETPQPEGWSDTHTLTSTAQSYMWDGLPTLGDGKSYVVVENKIKNGDKVSQTTTPDSSKPATQSATITVNGTTYSYVAEGEAKKTDIGGGVDYTITNKQVTSVPFKKIWGLGTTDSDWPMGTNITAGLYKETDTGPMLVETKTLSATDMTDAREVSPSLGGGGYIYTFTGLDQGYTYTVKETKVNNVDVNETTRVAGDYISIQEDATTVRNVPNNAQVSVTKAWATGSAPAGTNWSVAGQFTREKRVYGSTLESAWTADTAYAGGTFTISGTNASDNKTLPKYSYDAGTKTMWEYRYSAKETAVTIEGTNVTAAFTAAATRDAANANTITLTNTLPKTDVYFRKAWSDGEKEVAWPEVGGVPVAVTFTVKKQSREYGTNGAWADVSSESHVLSSSAVEKLLGQDKYGYDASTHKLVEYQYVVSEVSNIPTQFTKGETTGEGTAAKPYTVTNTPTTIPVSITKTWVNGPSGEWAVSGTISRERRQWTSDDSGTWEADADYDGTFTITGNNSDTATITKQLPQYGYANGKLWEYRNYDVEETVPDNCTSEKTGAAGSNSFTFTNTRESDDMDVTVEKVWQDEDGNTVVAPSGASATFTLYAVTDTALVVNAEGGQIGNPIKFKITDSSGQIVYRGQLDETNQWKYSHTPLLESESYTVSLDTSEGEAYSSSTYQSVTTSTSNAISGSTGGTVTFAATEKQPPSVKVWVDNGNFTGTDGFINIRIADNNGATVATKKLESGAWTYTFSRLDADKTYTVSLNGSTDDDKFDTSVFQSVTVPSNSISGSAGGTVSLEYVVKEVEAPEGSIPIKVKWKEPGGTLHNGNIGRIMIYSNSWTYNGTLDDLSRNGAEEETTHYLSLSNSGSISDSEVLTFVAYTNGTWYTDFDGATNNGSTVTGATVLGHGSELKFAASNLKPIGSKQITISFSPITSAGTGGAGGRISNSWLTNLFKPRVALADTATPASAYGKGTPTQAGNPITVDGTVDESTSSPREVESWKAKWSSLPRTDTSTGAAIRYYVKETSNHNTTTYKLDDATYAVNGGASYDASTIENGAINKTGTFTVSNPSSGKAKIKVRKRFLDVNGNPQGQDAISSTDPKFVLKRSKSSGSTSTGEYTVELYYSDNVLIGSVRADIGEKVIIGAGVNEWNNSGIDSSVYKYNGSEYYYYARTDWNHYCYKVTANDANNKVIKLKLGDILSTNTNAVKPSINIYNYNDASSGAIEVKLLANDDSVLDTINASIDDIVYLNYSITDTNRISLERYSPSTGGYVGANTLEESVFTGLPGNIVANYSGNESTVVCFTLKQALVYNNSLTLKLMSAPAFVTVPTWQIATEAGSFSPDSSYNNNSDTLATRTLQYSTANGVWNTDAEGPYWEAEYPNRVPLSDGSESYAFF